MTVSAAPVAAGGTLLALGLFFLQTGALVFGSGWQSCPCCVTGPLPSMTGWTRASSSTPS